jgi:hypothetical protein
VDPLDAEYKPMAQRVHVDIGADMVQCHCP